MSRIKDRQKAIELRKLGKTYSEIKNELGVAKSTLSDWLSKYPLTSKQLDFLEKSIKFNKFLGIEKIRITKQKKREERLLRTYREQEKQWSKLSQRELEIAGIFFYWGEGNKRLNGPVSFNNTDPQALKFMLNWLENGLRVPRSKIKVYLHLYKDMDINEHLKFWSRELGIPLSQFIKPYIKDSYRININHKGFGRGTCSLIVNDVRLKERVMMTIKMLGDSYSRMTEKSML